MRAPKPFVANLDPPSDLTGWLEVAAEKIRERDGLHWFDTGRELAEVKSRLDHGEFENWCYTKINYSKSKVEKLMRAAAKFLPLHESGTVTVLPPATVAYQLAGRKLPAGIWDEFLPRAIAGEDVGPELRQAIRAHRELAKQSKVPINVAAPGADNERGKVEQQAGQADRTDQSIMPVLDLIVSRLGNDLSKLIQYIDATPVEAVFTPDAVHELRERERMMRSTASLAEAETNEAQGWDETDETVTNLKLH